MRVIVQLHAWNKPRETLFVLVVQVVVVVAKSVISQKARHADPARSQRAGSRPLGRHITATALTPTDPLIAGCVNDACTVMLRTCRQHQTSLFGRSSYDLKVLQQSCVHFMPTHRSDSG
jgi:chorismate-pyruvate lyase